MPQAAEHAMLDPSRSIVIVQLTSGLTKINKYARPGVMKYVVRSAYRSNVSERRAGRIKSALRQEG